MQLTDELLDVHRGLIHAMEALARAAADPAADRHAMAVLAGHLSAAHAVLHDMGRRARDAERAGWACGSGAMAP